MQPALTGCQVAPGRGSSRSAAPAAPPPARARTDGPLRGVGEEPQDRV